MKLLYQVTISVRVPDDMWAAMDDEDMDELTEVIDDLDFAELIRTRLAFELGSEEKGNKLNIKVE